MDRNGLVVVSVACPDEKTAREIGAALVEARLAACAQTHPIHSIYRWQEAVETAGETMLTLKTTRAAFDALEAAVRARHPYDVPEIVAAELVEASQDYAQWVRESVGGGDAAT